MAPPDAGGEQPHKAHRQHRFGAKARKKKAKGKGRGDDDAEARRRIPRRLRFSHHQRPNVTKLDQQRLNNNVFMCQTAYYGPFDWWTSTFCCCSSRASTGKNRRVQFLECPNDINGMIDAAKIIDLALLLTDGSCGFEMVFLDDETENTSK